MKQEVYTGEVLYRLELVLMLSNWCRDIAMMPAIWLEEWEGPSSPLCGGFTQRVIVNLVGWHISDRDL